jgi:predicted Rossmann-fold nucleotide-binding protein
VFCGLNGLSTDVIQRGLATVYGGESVGLMGAVADGALAAGGAVIGVIPKWLIELEIAHAGLSELHIVETMHERTALMAELADRVIALPGGGPLDELFELFTWSQLGLHRKPIGLLADPNLERVHLILPNRHHLPFDVSRFGIEDRGEIFHATVEPYGLIEATVERSAGSDGL